MNLSVLGTEEEISAAVARLTAADQVNCAGKNVHFSVHAADNLISAIAHEVCENDSPIIGIVRFTLTQWAQLKDCLDPLVEKHAEALQRL